MQGSTFILRSVRLSCKPILRSLEKNGARPFGHVETVQGDGFHDAGFLRRRYRDAQVNVFPISLFFWGPSHSLGFHELIVGNYFQKIKRKRLDV
jgi:hypothetical protein